MSAPIDQHTLAIFVAALDRALDYTWSTPAGATASDIRAARQTAQALVAWGRTLCAVPPRPWDAALPAVVFCQLVDDTDASE
jgi:hypothetical protein